MGSNTETIGIITLNKPVDKEADRVARNEVNGFVRLSHDKTIMIFDDLCGGKFDAEEYLKALIRVIAPLGYVLNGKLDCINTDYLEMYGIFVKGNKVKVKAVSKIVYKDRAVSTWNLTTRVFNLIPFHLPEKLIRALVFPQDSK